VLTQILYIVGLGWIGYAAKLGPSGAWIAESKPIMLIGGIAVAPGLMLVAGRGLALGKWVHNLGGLTLVVIFLLMVGLALLHFVRGRMTQLPVALTVPAFTLYNLNIFGKMTFGAMGGFDGVAIFAGEYRAADAGRSIRHSVFLSAPVIALMFILGTACVLVFTKPDDIDLVSPIAQIISRGTAGWSLGRMLAPAILAALFIGRITQASLIFNATTRLPMVTGWDHLLPSWFSRLHPRYKTPVGAIVFIGVLTMHVDRQGLQDLERAHVIVSNLRLHSAHSRFVTSTENLTNFETPVRRSVVSRKAALVRASSAMTTSTRSGLPRCRGPHFVYGARKP
jgi:amino acid transporter